MDESVCVTSLAQMGNMYYRKINEKMGLINARMATMERNLNDIEVFTKVVDARSFTSAAKRMGLPNSTVSRRVARLEEQLGVKLLRRTTRKLSLTESGQLFYERSVRALAEIEAAENILAQTRNTPRGRVKVIVPVEHAISLRLVTEFLTKFPEVRVDMEFSSRNLNIIQEGFDAAIHIGPVTNMSVIAHKLMDSPFCMVASPSYLQQSSPQSITSLTEYDCLIFGPSSANAAWDLVSANKERIRIPVRGRLAVNHMQAIRDAAVAGLGIALLPLVVCRSDIKDGLLQIVLDGVVAPSVPIYITYPSGKFLAPAVRAFVDYIRSRFGEVFAGN